MNRPDVSRSGENQSVAQNNSKLMGEKIISLYKLLGIRGALMTLIHTKLPDFITNEWLLNILKTLKKKRLNIAKIFDFKIIS